MIKLVVFDPNSEKSISLQFRRTGQFYPKKSQKADLSFHAIKIFRIRVEICENIRAEILHVLSHLNILVL